jgi:exopolysaccharide biosynthesis polyprenyl glycosylphosphotransferase
MNFIAQDAPRSRWLGIVFWIGDIVVAIAAMLFADWLRRALPFGATPDRYYVTPDVLLLVAVIWSGVFYFLGAYERRTREELRVEARTVFLAVTFSLFTLAAALYFYKIENFSRVLFIYFYLLDLGLTLGWRSGFRFIQMRRGTRTTTRRSLIVGTDASAQELGAQLAGWTEFTLVGFVAEKELTEGTGSAPVLGILDDALKIVDRAQVTDVFLSQTARGRVELAELILALRERHVRVRVMPDLLELITVRTGIETLRGIPVITLREPTITGFNSVLKRALDLIGAVLGLLVLGPFMLVVAAMIRFDSPGPIIFSQERAGQYGKPFLMYKFRSMVQNAEELLDELVNVDELPQPQFKLKHDPRVTRVGAWLRKTSFDEVPQLFNVLLGSMSLVGPRPEMMRLVVRYSPVERQRLLVKPGLTGTMQISGRGDLSFDERMKLELDYIENYSIWRDLVILVKTVPAVLSGRGAY